MKHTNVGYLKALAVGGFRLRGAAGLPLLAVAVDRFPVSITAGPGESVPPVYKSYRFFRRVWTSSTR